LGSERRYFQLSEAAVAGAAVTASSAEAFGQTLRHKNIDTTPQEYIRLYGTDAFRARAG
jgi:hypothetical protein